MSGAAASATALLFRSVRAARSWVRAGGASLDPRARACALMKPGEAGAPVFMIPGAPGSVLQLAPLAEAIPGTMPVYAIKPRGLAAGEIPARDLGEMAEHTIGAMRAVQPHGPYRLVGYSAGGLVALETARRLAAGGQKVPLVVLLDTYPSREVWPLGCHAEILVRQALRALWGLRRYTIREAAADVRRRLRSLGHYLAYSGVGALPKPPVLAEGSDTASRRVYLATYEAGEAYRPERYDGRVVFLQPALVPNLEPRAPAKVWRRFLPALEIRRVPGSHLGMLEPAAAAAAGAEIGRCLDDGPSR